MQIGQFEGEAKLPISDYNLYLFIDMELIMIKIALNEVHSPLLLCSVGLSKIKISI